MPLGPKSEGDRHAGPAFFRGAALFDRNQTLWASWVISNAVSQGFFQRRFRLFHGVQGNRRPVQAPFDITFLECGAYDLLWHKVHMLPEETALAHLDLKGRVLCPIHWGTFNLALQLLVRTHGADQDGCRRKRHSAYNAQIRRDDPVRSTPVRMTDGGRDIVKRNNEKRP